MVGEGIAPEMIDKAALQFGMPMGPIELADTVGLDVCKSVATILSGGETLDMPKKMQHMLITTNWAKKPEKVFINGVKATQLKIKKQAMAIYRNCRTEWLCVS